MNSTLTEAALEQALITAFKDRGAYSIHGVGMIPPRQPSWWQRRDRDIERRINAALAQLGIGPLDSRMRELYWREVAKGQDIHEDAGGYKMRCWCAAIGLPYRETTRSYSSLVLELDGLLAHRLEIAKTLRAFAGGSQEVPRTLRWVPFAAMIDIADWLEGKPGRVDDCDRIAAGLDGGQ